MRRIRNGHSARMATRHAAIDADELQQPQRRFSRVTTTRLAAARTREKTAPRLHREVSRRCEPPWLVLSAVGWV